MMPYRKSPQGMWILSFCAPFQKRAEPLGGLRRCACVGGVVSAHTRRVWCRVGWVTEVLSGAGGMVVIMGADVGRGWREIGDEEQESDGL